MEPTDGWKMTFKTKFGLKDWLFMHFSLTNALATFMQIVNDITYPHLNEFVVACLVDILVFKQNLVWSFATCLNSFGSPPTQIVCQNEEVILCPNFYPICGLFDWWYRSSHRSRKSSSFEGLAHTYQHYRFEEFLGRHGLLQEINQPLLSNFSPTKSCQQSKDSSLDY